MNELAERVRKIEHKIFHDHFQNYKRHAIQRAQLLIADIPYNIGKNAYGSSVRQSGAARIVCLK